MNQYTERGRPSRPNGGQDRKLNDTGSDTLCLKNSRVTLERGPAGTVARIERTTDGYTREYAGPLDPATVDALEEVAGRV